MEVNYATFVERRPGDLKAVPRGDTLYQWDNDEEGGNGDDDTSSAGTASSSSAPGPPAMLVVSRNGDGDGVKVPAPWYVLLFCFLVASGVVIWTGRQQVEGRFTKLTKYRPTTFDSVKLNYVPDSAPSLVSDEDTAESEDSVNGPTLHGLITGDDEDDMEAEIEAEGVPAIEKIAMEDAATMKTYPKTHRKSSGV